MKELLHLDIVIKFCKHIVFTVFQSIAKIVLRKYKPRIIAVTGSVGKTSTKDLIFSILKKQNFVWKSVKSYNNEIGVPLTILGLETGWRNPFAWILNFFRALTYVVLRRAYPALLVLEVGADAPGDIKKVMRWITPSVSVLTSMGTTPVHVEFFSSPEQVAQEKAELVKALRSDGIAVLNRDDEKVYAMRSVTTGHIVTYGFHQEAKFGASSETVWYENDIPIGMTFKLEYEGKSIPVRLRGVLGRGQTSVALAALATTITLGIAPLEAIAAVEAHTPPPGRARLLPGIKRTIIIDDTYNSSPVAVHIALETLSSLKTSARKIVVLGDMMELGQFTKEEHEKVGTQVATIANDLFAVGPRALFIAEAAKRSGMLLNHVFLFDDARKCGVYLEHYIKKGDIVFIKGSQSVRLERIVEEIMAEPEKAAILLVRQDGGWKKH